MLAAATNCSNASPTAGTATGSEAEAVVAAVSASGSPEPLHPAASATSATQRRITRTRVSLAGDDRRLPRLLLLRHAKSSWDDPSLADRDRPLAPRGRKAASRIARHLGERDERPDLVLCSPATRTRQTLERLSLDPSVRVEFNERLYAASAAALLALLRALPASAGTVLVVGHNPGLEELALELAVPGPHRERIAEKFPTGALATLAFDGAWAELARGACTLVDYVVPRDL